MIKLVILDLYGVVTRGSYVETCRWLGKKYKRNWKDLYSILYHKYFNRAAMGELSEKEFFVEALAEFGFKIGWKVVRDKHLSFQHPNKGVVEFAKSLMKKGIIVVVLSKNIPEHFVYIKNKFKLESVFPHMINTFDLKLPKASPLTIKYLLKNFKVKASEVIMIDDQDFNLPAAKKMGAKVILYKNLKDLKKQVKKFV